jgi:hypothetical protein
VWSVTDGRIMLKWTLKEYGVRMWTGFSWLEMEVQWQAHVGMVQKL